MSTNKREMLDFLLSAVFDIKQGFSYNNLLEMLNSYKTFYSECYTLKERYRKDLLLKNKTITDLECRIKELDDIKIEKDNINNILSKQITKKLTWKERFIGKSSWKNDN